jgi:hypothetical protein
MAENNNTDLQEIYKAALEEAKKKAKSKKREEEEEEGEEEEEEEEESSKKKMEEETESDLDEETLAARSLKPAAKSVSDPKSKIGMIQAVIGAMHGAKKEDLTHWYTQAMAQFGPGKDWGVGDKSGANQSTLDMNPSHAEATKGPKTKYPMPKLNVKEDMDELFVGQDLSEEFKENVSTLFEAAVNARAMVEIARLEEEYEAKISEELATFNEELTTKLDTYLDYVVEQWMKENEVAIESTLRNELMEEFMDGLKNLFSEHYISVPQTKVDVLETLAQKVNELEGKLDESITENVALRNTLLEANRTEVFESLAQDLALTQQEKFSALAEGIEFDGDLETYEKKLKIIKENYFKTETTSYSSNIEEETFEGESASQTVNVDPSVNRYVQAIARNVKK